MRYQDRSRILTLDITGTKKTTLMGLHMSNIAMIDARRWTQVLSRYREPSHARKHRGTCGDGIAARGAVVRELVRLLVWVIRGLRCSSPSPLLVFSCGCS